MSHGLRTWTAAGLPDIDTGVRLARIVAVWQVYQPLLSDDELQLWYPYDSPVIPGLANDGTWYAMTPGVCSKISFIGGGRVRALFYSNFQADNYIYVTIGRF